MVKRTIYAACAASAAFLCVTRTPALTAVEAFDSLAALYGQIETFEADAYIFKPG